MFQVVYNQYCIESIHIQCLTLTRNSCNKRTVSRSQKMVSVPVMSRQELWYCSKTSFCNLRSGLLASCIVSRGIHP